MPQKKQTKLETNIHEIIIVNNKKLTPYIELVNFSSKNIDQKKLGTILGIFEIKDTSDDSAYIVNFLSSTAKKTYFASHQKNPEESFESTLAKVNLSLSEIAKHGNVNWVGKIDAVLCSVFENQINFSVSGEAKVLLLRNNKLTEISAGLSPKDEAANPLKTFTDIASGKLDVGDKLILTTDDISHIFSLEDLEKHAISFSKDKFLRFLKTALVNELDIAGTIVIDTEKVKVKEKIIESKPEPIEIEKESLNLFGSQVFEEKIQKEKEKQKNILPENTPPSDKKEYVNKKTGHIYISDSNDNYDEFREDKIGLIIQNLKENLSDFIFWIKEKYFKKGSYKIKKSLTSFHKKNSSVKITSPTKSFWGNLSTQALKIKEKIKKTSRPKLKEGVRLPNFNSNFSEKNIPSNNSSAPGSGFLKTIPQSISTKSTHSFLKKTFEKIKYLGHNLGRILYQQSINLFNLIKKILPHLSFLKNTFLKMNLKFKLITLGIILAIFIVPFLFFRDKNENLASIENTTSPTEELKINPSSETYRETSQLYSNGDLIGLFGFNNQIFAISKNKISEVGEKNKDYTFPDNFKNAQAYSFMHDLNLLFIVNDKNQIISFSPISLKFKEDSINIESNIKIEGLGTYLTYLYIVDSANKKIYRYPRADNGFGEKIDWLQSEISFDNITGLAIDGNLYLAQKNGVLKLFNRKKQDFNLNIDANSSVDEIFTHEDSSAIYILDNLNGELDKFDKNGNKQVFVSNQNLTQAKKIWIDEKNSTAYFVTENALYKINLP